MHGAGWGATEPHPSSHLQLLPEWDAFPPNGSDAGSGLEGHFLGCAISSTLYYIPPNPPILGTCLVLTLINEDFGGRKAHYPTEEWFGW